MTAEQIEIISDLGRKTAADRISRAACDIILEGSEGKASVSLRSGPKRGRSGEMRPAGFETLLNLTMDVVAEVRRSTDEPSDLSASDIRNLVFAMIA